MSQPLPTIDELREFSRLTWVRCPSCGKPFTKKMQDTYDRILQEKAITYNQELEKAKVRLSATGLNQKQINKIAEQEANNITDLEFNAKVKRQVGIERLCCFNNLMNPIIIPLGSGVELDPVVDVGQRMSTMNLGENKVKRIFKTD